MPALLLFLSKLSLRFTRSMHMHFLFQNNFTLKWKQLGMNKCLTLSHVDCSKNTIFVGSYFSLKRLVLLKFSLQSSNREELCIGRSKDMLCSDGEQSAFHQNSIRLGRERVTKLNAYLQICGIVVRFIRCCLEFLGHPCFCFVRVSTELL